MKCRTLEITIISANNLENVHNLPQMEVYAVASIAGSRRTEKRTPVDHQGEMNPVWNCPLTYNIREESVQQQVALVIKLYCQQIGGDQYVGEVHPFVKELYDLASADGGCAIMNFPVKNGFEDSQGELKFLCRFGDLRSVGRPSKVKKALSLAARVVLTVTIGSIVGGHIPFDIPLLDDVPCLNDVTVDHVLEDETISCYCVDG